MISNYITDMNKLSIPYSHPPTFPHLFLISKHSIRPISLDAEMTYNTTKNRLLIASLF